MKKLIESLLDDEDVLIKNTNIPTPPKVSRKDYPYYEQAWHDCCDVMFTKNNTPEKWAKFLEVYVDWLSDWECLVTYGDYEDVCQEVGEFDWYVEVYQYIHKLSDIEDLKAYIKVLIREFEAGKHDRSKLSQYGSNSIMYSLYDNDNAFNSTGLCCGFFAHDNRYDKYLKQIQKRLIFAGIKL